MDTPETKHPQKSREYFGVEATSFTRHAIEGKEIRMKYDWQQRDRYGRMLAYVYRESDGFFLNAEIIKQGYGRAYLRFPFKFKEEFRLYEQKARQQQKGLWKSLDATN